MIPFWILIPVAFFFFVWGYSYCRSNLRKIMTYEIGIEATNRVLGVVNKSALNR